MKNPYKDLEKKLGYRFRKRRHLEIALTHRSFRYEKDHIEADNQRLEFLGDAALGLVAGAYLFGAFPDLQEGDLTRIRSRLTNAKSLANIALSIDLGSHIRLGRGEQQSGGHERTSNLGDALEAVIGAAFLDGGMRAVERMFKKLFVSEIDPEAYDRWQDNPKGALQELAQQQFKTSPRYRTVGEKGPAHSRVFTVEVLIEDKPIARGSGTNKREAESQAAMEALRMIRQELGARDLSPG